MSNHQMDSTTACWGAFALLAAVLGAPAQAAGGDSLAGTAHGTFSQVGETLEVVDGFAYEAVGRFGDPVIEVVLVSVPLDRDTLAAVMDFEVELGRRELLAEHFEISGGRIKGDRAELLVETRDEGETQRGSIFYQRVDAGWRWIGQRMEPVYDDE